MSEYPGFPAPESGEGEDRWLLSQAVLDLDAEADAGGDITDMIARHVDPDAAIWMARQRAMRAMMLGDPASIATSASAWMDGFLAGMIVQHLKTRPPSGDEDGEHAAAS